MNRILLMRHAKSAWDQPGLSDRQRPLNQRGQKAAEQMGNWLLQQNRIPDIILASPAIRTQQTIELLLAAINLSAQNLNGSQRDTLNQDGVNEQVPSIEVQTVESLYLAPPHALLEAIGQTHSKFRTVLLVAHNPGLEELVSFVAHQYHRFPTAAVAEIAAINQDWEAALTNPKQFVGQCQMTTIWRPKELFIDQK